MRRSIDETSANEQGPARVLLPARMVKLAAAIASGNLRKPWP